MTRDPFDLQTQLTRPVRFATYKKNPLAQDESMWLQEDKFTFVRRDIKFYNLEEDGRKPPFASEEKLE